MKQRIFKLIEKGSHGSKTNLIFDYFIMTLILLNVVAMILESVETVFQSFQHVLLTFEIISMIIFLIEYILRLYVADLIYPEKSKFKARIKFIFSAYGMIDLFAILPFFLPFIIKTDLRFLRIIRLTRFLRIIKLDRYTRSLNTIIEIIRDKKHELGITGFMAMLVLLISSFIIFEVEGKAQPDVFPNILASIWWAVATLTTVGYGDIYPITVLGKFISGVIAFTGIGLVALPTGIIGAGFIERIKKTKNTCPHCGKEIK